MHRRKEENENSERINTNFTRQGNNDRRNAAVLGRNNNTQPRNTETANASDRQRHVHEVLGSTQIAQPVGDAHSHRFATVSGEAIPIGFQDHVHEIKFRTDFYENHYHEFCGKTSGAIETGDGHVHYLQAHTTRDGNHRHEFRLTTLIENPTGE